jgi:hypothetical protein
MTRAEGSIQAVKRYQSYCNWTATAAAEGNSLRQTRPKAHDFHVSISWFVSVFLVDGCIEFDGTKTGSCGHIAATLRGRS